MAYRFDGSRVGPGGPDKLAPPFLLILPSTLTRPRRRGCAASTLLEPIQIHLVEVPDRFMGAITKLIGGKRGQLIDVGQEGSTASITAKLPVAEMIGWSSDLRSATEGRGISSLKDQLFEPIPRDMQPNVIRKIRDRKGLAENQ